MTIQRRNEESYTALSTPEKLRAMLNDAEALGFDDIVCWQPGGASFKVLQPERFAKEIMQSYFNQTKYKSFQRQLNIYGFKRIHLGPNMGGYVSRQFKREAPELSALIVRRPTKQVVAEHTKLRSKASVNFPLKNKTTDTIHTKEKLEEIKLEDSEVQAFYDFFYPKDPAEQALVSSIFESVDCISGSFHISGNDWHYDHCCQGKGGMDEMIPSLLRSEEEQDEIMEDEHYSFPWKVHLLLEKAEKGNFQHIVSWVKDGSAFKVHNSALFMEKVMPNYFDQIKYESFRRQLNLYGFSRVSKGSDRGVISHPMFVEGAREQCRNIARNIS